MRNPIKRALIRLRRPPFEGRWAPEAVGPFEMLTTAHERMRNDKKRRYNRPL